MAVTISVSGGGAIDLQNTGGGTGLLNEDGATRNLARGGVVNVDPFDGSPGLTNTGSGGFDAGGGPYPPGSSTVTNSGSVAVQGALENDAAITNMSTGRITIASTGTITNLGTITNSGTIQNNSGTFNGGGTCTNVKKGTGC